MDSLSWNMPRDVIGASLRTIATIIVVVAIYFLIPMDHAMTATTVIELVTGGLGGHWWWVAVTAAAGLIVGLLNRWLRVPEQTAGIIAEVSTGQFDARLVPATVLISAVSLIGGASLGPEKALGSMGGGAATWIARRRALGNEDSQVSVLSGMAGAYGGMLSSPVIVVMLFLEVARPGAAVVVGS